MHADIAQKRDALAALCRRFGVARLEVFGSAARGTDFDSVKSDADFLVEFEPSAHDFSNYLDFKDALEKLLGRPVDLVNFSAVENPYLRAAINRSRELIYGA